MYVHSVQRKTGTIVDCFDKIDLEPIAFKLINSDLGEQGVSEGEVYEMITQYRQFLKLIAMYPDHPIVPSKSIDKVWHAHILDTAKYEVDCQDVFGYFLHHFPYFELRGEQDEKELHQAYVLTQKLFAQHFGVSLNSDPAECVQSCSRGCHHRIETLLKCERPRFSL